jgi:hypothetical protein
MDGTVTRFNSIGIQVRDMKIMDGWVVGYVADELIPPSARAEHIEPRNAFLAVIQRRELATVVPPFYLPMASENGFFRKTRSEILADFTALTRGDDAMAIYFLRRFGLWCEDDLYQKDATGQNRLPPTSLLPWWLRAEGEGKIPFATSLDYFWRCYDIAKLLNDLRDALLRSDVAALKKLCLALGNSFFRDRGKSLYKEAPDPKKEAHFLLAMGTGRFLGSARVAPIEENGKIFPVISTAFSREAVFAELMRLIVAGNPLQYCLRKQCNNIFAPAPKKRYCSNICQIRNKRARQLGKTKEETERSDTSLRGGKSNVQTKRSHRKN